MLGKEGFPGRGGRLEGRGSPEQGM